MTFLLRHFAEGISFASLAIVVNYACLNITPRLRTASFELQVKKSRTFKSVLFVDFFFLQLRLEQPPGPFVSLFLKSKFRCKDDYLAKRRVRGSLQGADVGGRV